MEKLSLREAIALWAMAHQVDRDALIPMVLRQAVYLRIGTIGDTCNRIAADLEERMRGFIEP